MTKNNAVILTFISALALPVLFQNCAKPNQSFSQVSGSSSQSLNTDSLPPNSETQVGSTPSVATSSDNSSSNGNEMSFQVVDGGKTSGDKDDQDDKDTVQAKSDCANYKKSKSGSISKKSSTTSEMISGLNGNHMLTPDDFGGQAHVNCIDNIHGKIILCGLKVDEIKNVSGRMILIDSEVAKSSDSNGRIDLISSHIQNLSSFKGTVNKHN
jgi:hypothetical protein